MSERKAIHALIVDDEPLGRKRLADLVGEHPDVEIVGTLADGAAAVEQIRSLKPDLVFLDIQMPGLSGLDVVRTVGPSVMPVTVFVTAHDDYALQAFDLTAIDYLLKPYSDERFGEALDRARRRIRLEELDVMREQLVALLNADVAGRVEKRADQEPYLDRIAVPMRGRLRVVSVKEIDHITASGVYAEICVGTERHLVRDSLQSLARRLDPERFVRVHRSQIVQIDRIDALLRGGGGTYRVKLKDGSTLPVGRTHRLELERRLGRA